MQSDSSAAWKFEDATREADLVTEFQSQAAAKAKGGADGSPTKKIRYNETLTTLMKPPRHWEFKNPDSSMHPKWSNVSDSPMYLFGDEAIYAPPEEPYEVIYPLQRGEFNKTISRATVCDLLHQHWADSIEKYLEIPPKAFKDYATCLVVRDTMDKNEVTEIIHVLLRRMRFRAIFVFQESVAAAYGSGTETACVVDVGHQTTSICCVENGMSIPETRLNFPNGGDDVSHLVHWLLQHVGGHDVLKPGGENEENTEKAAGKAKPSEDTGTSMANPQVAHIITRMKEDLCYFPFGGDGSNALSKMECTFPVQYNPKGPLKFYTMVQDEMHGIAAMAYFNPKLAHSIVGRTPPPSDLDTKTFTPISTAVISASQPNAEHTALDVSSLSSPEARMVAPMALDEGIMVSIRRSGLNDAQEGLSEHKAELKRKLFINIVLCGGGALMRGLMPALEERVMEQLMKTTESVHAIEVLPWQPDIPPNQLAWKGASVAATTDASRDMYIQQNEAFENGGLHKCMRERSSFYW